ncbi:pentapeptide repeat-containing protein [Streptomyces sp. SID12501]|uniref:Pentapeptide repeat-containing protein n=1 Tax=Streptomyces sp. SID12501 TaxID=2706042 RepID=A0A6B3BPK9_9ACTN|nr:pentapeptide repeat-containing protein [Streptomyces sp. SID12501]
MNWSTALPPARPLHGDLRIALEKTEHLTRGSAQELTELDMAAPRGDVNALLLRTSELVRAKVTGRKKDRKDRRGTDLIGADLRDANLTGSIFLTQPQLDAAKGDISTKLPSALSRPTHW